MSMRNTESKAIRFIALAASAVLLMFALAACSSSSKSNSGSGTTVPSASSADITIKNLTFPSRVDAQTGSTVTVKNDDTVTHTVTANDGSFNITIDAGKTGTFTAPKTEGQYDYHCNIHSQMKGTLNVQ